MNNKIAIGVTGSFGSGCTTVKDVLEKRFNFKPYSVSQFLKDEWARAEFYADNFAVRVFQRFSYQTGFGQLQN